jgi:predicted AAA+ superfamily ATPase
LLGRYEIIRAHHWGLKECQEEFGWNQAQYLQYGGYPAAAALAGDAERWQRFMLDSVVEPVIARDISFVREIAKPALFRQALSLVMQHPAMELSYQKILGQLQDHGNATTIKSYLETLEHAFLIKILTKFSTRAITTKSSSPKIFPLCPALISAFSGASRTLQDPESRGRVVEAAIGAQLSQLFPEGLFYWRDGHNEVDFVVASEQQLFAIEVKSGRKKRRDGVAAFKKNFPQALGFILSEELIGETLTLDSKGAAIGFFRRIGI